MLNHEYWRDISFRNFGFSLKNTALQPTRTYMVLDVKTLNRN
jgi:hypothetical protein